MYKIINYRSTQLDLDLLIHRNKELGNVYQNKEVNKQMRVACWVELGELANEIEFFKYWKLNKRKDKEKQLDEFADVMHFLLSLMNVEGQKTYDVLTFEDIESAFKFGKKLYPDRYTLTRLFDKVMKNIIYKDYDQAFISLTHTMLVLGFTPNELEGAYLNKNRVNYKRQEENY